MAEYESVKSSGASVQSGTKYKDIQLAGATKFVNDVECSTFKSSGALKSEGSIKAVLFKAAGAVKILGSLEAPQISVSGGASIGKDVITEVAKFGGSVTVGGKISAKELHVGGSIEVKGEVLADTFELILNGKSTLDEVYGDEITIEKEWSFGSSQPKRAFVNLIEATKIELAHTTCKKVSGDVVVIGEGCDIGLVEYKVSLEIHKKAKVKEQVKLE
jgi:cytoskeletal protein CcmA (bactofilin family)